VYRLILEDDSSDVFIEGQLADTLLGQGFGEPAGASRIRVNSFEGVYLVFRDRFAVKDKKAVINALSQGRKDFWTVYHVYSDLLDQGKKITFDERTGCIMQKEGEKRVYIPLSSDDPLTPTGIHDKAKALEELGWAPVLAIVDEHGTPAYYSADTKKPSVEGFGSD